VLNFLAMSPFYPEMSTDLHVSVSVVGQLVTFMVLLSAILGLVLGPVVDRYGFRRLMVLGVACVSINQIGIGLSPRFPFMLVVSLIGGFGDALVFGIAFAIAGTLFVDSERKRAYSLLTGAMSLGAIVGIPLLTVIGSLTSWRLALISCGLAITVAALFAARVLPHDQRRIDTPWDLKVFRDAYAPVLRDPTTVRLLLVTAIRSVCWIGFLTYMGAFLSEAQHLSTRQIGVVYMIGAAGFATGCSIANRMFGPERTREAVGIGCVVSAILTFAVVVAPNPWRAVAFITLLAMASAVVGIGATFLVSTASPGEPGTTMMLNGSMGSFGTAAGAAIGGGLIALNGYQALGIGLPVFALIGAVLVLWTHPATKDARELPSTGELMVDSPVLPGAKSKTGASL
jgi:predicted MFS family arabinose efflux permease